MVLEAAELSLYTKSRIRPMSNKIWLKNMCEFFGEKFLCHNFQENVSLLKELIESSVLFPYLAFSLSHLATK